jgi:hypothetical protein
MDTSKMIEKSTVGGELRRMFNQAVRELLDMRQAQKEGKLIGCVAVRAQIGMTAFEWTALGRQDVLQVRELECKTCKSGIRADHGFCHQCGEVA